MDGAGKVQKAIVFSFMVVSNTYYMAGVTHKFGAVCRVLVGGNTTLRVFILTLCAVAGCVTSSGRLWHGREGSRDA